MALSKTLVVVVALSLVGVSSAYAQRRGGGGASRGGARMAAPRGYAAPRGLGGSPRGFAGGVRAFAPSRIYGGGVRGFGGGRVVAPRIAGPRVIGPRVGGSFRFYRPYYTFRPRFSLGFGLWVGFPIAYPYYYGYYGPYDYYPYGYYGYPYAYSYPSAYPPYGYPSYPAANTARDVRPYGPSSVRQSQSSAGGISFEVTPNTAEVYVDGSFVGTVGQFTPTTQPLGLTPGRHRIEIRAAGLRSLDFEENIVAGEVIPYQGTLER